MSWQVILTPGAERDLHRLPDLLQKRVVDKLATVAKDPARFVERLKGTNAWKLRIGDYRALLFLDTDLRRIEVVRVRHRSVVYR